MKNVNIQRRNMEIKMKKEVAFMMTEREKQRKRSKFGLLIGAVFVLGLAVMGCNKSLDFKKIEVPRSENNPAAYTVYSVTDKKMTYQFDQNFYDEKVVEGYVKQFQNLQQKAQEYTGIKPEQEITICVLETTPFGGTYVKDHILYCKISDLEKGSYKPWFLQAYYNLQQPWVAFGINQNISSKGALKEDLTKHYEKNENMIDLTLFGGCFIKEISAKEDYEIAVSTASELVDFLIKNKKAEQVIQGKIGKEDKQNWLTSIGVKGQYQESGEEAFGKSIYTKNEQCVLEIQNYPTTFQMNLIPLIQDSAGMRDWVIEDYEAQTKMASYLEKHLNLKYNKKKISQINYLVKKDAADNSYDEKSNTYYYTIQNHVFSLQSTLSLALELQKKEYNWKDIILSYWLTSSLYEGQDKGLAKEYQLNMDEHVNEDYFTNQTYESYLKNDPDYLQNHLIDVRLMDDIRAIYAKDKDEVICNRWKIIQNKATEEEKLTTYEEISFVNYIGEQYGEDVVVRHLLCREDFQKLTGKSTSELLAAWRTYLDTLKK